MNKKITIIKPRKYSAKNVPEFKEFSNKRGEQWMNTHYTIVNYACKQLIAHGHKPHLYHFPDGTLLPLTKSFKAEYHPRVANTV